MKGLNDMVKQQEGFYMVIYPPLITNSEFTPENRPGPKWKVVLVSFREGKSPTIDIELDHLKKKNMKK